MRKHEKHLSMWMVLLLIAAMLIGTTGIVGAAEPVEYPANLSRPDKALSDLTFYFASPLVANPFWDEVQSGWEDACAYYGVNCEFIGPTVVDINEQLKYFEAAMAQGVDGIVTDPLNPAQFQTIFQQATEMGIPVVAMDSDAPESARIAYYGSENKAAGKLLAETLVTLTDGNGKIGILTGVLDAENLHERIAGMEEVFANHPDMEIVAMEGDDYLIDVGIQKVTAMFQAHPEMNTIVGLHSQTPQAIGAALKELGLVGKVKATGWDASPEGIDYVKEGVLDALLVQRPYDMGWRSLYGLLTIAEGYPEYVAGVNDTGMSVVTRDNVDTYDQKNDPLARPGKQLADMSYYFASPLVANPFWDDVQAGWEDACAFYGVNCEFAGPTVVDINEQLKYFEAAMAQNVDGIVTDPLNPAQFQTTFQQSTDMGIPVVAMDSDAPDSARVAYYGSDNTNAGKLLARTLVKLTAEKGKIGILTGVLDAENLHERINGMEEVFAEYPEMEIVAMEGDDYLIDVGIQKVTAMFQAHPEMNTIAGLHSQTPQAVGAALKELGLVGKVTATAWDAAPEGIDYVKEGVLQALLTQKPYAMGYWSAKALIAISSGFKQDVVGVHDTGMLVVDQSNVEQFEE